MERLEKWSIRQGREEQCERGKRWWAFKAVVEKKKFVVQFEDGRKI